MRPASPTTSAPPDRDAVARAAAVLLLTLRGTPFLYYGEEIRAARRRHRRTMRASTRPRPGSCPISTGGTGRDAERRCRGRPVPERGFTTGRPWLRLGPDAESRNVQAQAADPRSVLVVVPPADRAARRDAGAPGRCVPSAIRCRRDVVAYTRETADQIDPRGGQPGPRQHLVAAARRRARGTGWRPLFGTSGTARRDESLPGGTTLILAAGRGRRPRGGALIERGECPCYHGGQHPPQSPGSTTCRSIS